MFVYVIKASKLKFFAVVLFSAIILLTLIALTPGYNEVPTQDVAAVSTKYGKLSTNEDRVKFIEQFGYSVTPDPLEITDVNIPEKFDFIKEEDMQTLVSRALKEGNPGYPVPKIRDAAECEKVIRSFMI